MIAAGAPPDPSRTLAILFGASRWPEFPGLDNAEAAASYTTAAASIRSYLIGSDGLDLPKANFKDLFDSDELPSIQDKAIDTFIMERSAGAATIQDVIVFYVGHGSTMQGGKFLFILRSTDRERRETTSYWSETLGKTLKKSAPLMRKWIVLDCCCAQAAFGDFVPASEVERVLETDAETSFPANGAAFYAACSADNFAYNDPRSGGRMFTAALVHVLKEGATALGERLTLSEVANLVRSEINSRYGPDGTRPWIGDPDSRRGELSTIPFFPNAKRRRDPLTDQVAALQKGMGDLERRVTERLGRMDQVLDRLEQEQATLAARPVANGAPLPSVGAFGNLDWNQDVRANRAGLIPKLTSGERKHWDEAVTGYSTGQNILLVAAVLLAVIAGCWMFAITGFFRLNGLTIIYGFRTITCVAAVTAVPCIFAYWPLGGNKSAELPLGESPALDTLLAYDEWFRRVYTADYGRTPFGPIHRRKAITALCCLIAAAILTFPAYLD